MLVSTAQMLRSISDVYACRRDYFDKNKAAVEKVAAAYLKAGAAAVAMGSSLFPAGRIMVDGPEVVAPLVMAALSAVRSEVSR